MNTKTGVIIAGLVILVIIIVLVIQDRKNSTVPTYDYSAETQAQLEDRTEAEMQAEQVPMEPEFAPVVEPEPTEPINPTFPTTGFKE